MFKIEVDVNGTIHGHYFMNAHEDDFIQFLPKHFIRTYGEDITPDKIKCFKMDESKMSLLEGKIAQHEANEIDESEAGKLKVCRVEKARFEVGQEVDLEDYDKVSLEREEKFKDAKKTKKKKAPKTTKIVSRIVDEVAVDVEVVTVDATDDLAKDAVSLELELVGVEMENHYPYDSKGKFLGNK